MRYYQKITRLVAPSAVAAVFCWGAFAGDTSVNSATCSIAAAGDIKNSSVICTGATQEQVIEAVKQAMGPLLSKFGDISKQSVVIDSTNAVSRPGFSYKISTESLRIKYKEAASDYQPWLKCSNGMCYYSGLTNILPSVRRLHIGSHADQLDRTIEVSQVDDASLVQYSSFRSASTARQPAIPSVPNSRTFVKLEFFDGSLSAIETELDNNDDPTIRGAALSAIQSGPGTPIVIVAFNPKSSLWSVLPGDTNEVIKAYSTDQDGLFETDRPNGGQWFGAFNLKDIPPNGLLRLSFINKVGTVTGPFSYMVPLGLIQDANAAVFRQRANHLVICKRFTAAMLGPTEAESKNDFAKQMKRVNIAMALNGEGWSFIDQPGVACIIPSRLPPNTLPAIKALQGVYVRPKPGVDQPVITAVRQSGGSNAVHSPELGNLMHILLPITTEEVDISYVLYDGTRSEETRITIQ